MIRVLDKHVADKIAAGEVIDRPVSIIKELLENAIDAKASNITIEFKNGGKSYIRVTDNGCGIEAEDMEVAFKRHATSKITSASDLDSIGTLGFRGEALASICAVSRVELISKTSTSKMGRRIVIEGSETILNEGTGCPDGTTITVRDLFYNVPARLKFLSSDTSEARRITDMVSRIALSYDNIKITLINGNKKVFTTQGRCNPFNSIVNIYGSDIGKDLLPIDMELNDLKIKGFISSPSASAPSRNRQIFAVNGRVVTSKLLEKALEDGYKEKLFAGRFPVAFLFISMAAEKLDVNIHPTKKEVRFDNEIEISDFVCKAVSEALKAKEALPQVRAKNEYQKITEAPKPEISTNYSYTIKETTSQAKEVAEEQVDINNILSTMRQEAITEEKSAEIPIDEPSISGPFDFGDLNYLGSIFNTYIIATDDSDFYLIDQHAAHERIFYEKLMKQYEAAEKYSQQLLVPISLNASSYAVSTEDQWLPTLRKIGYLIEFFGGKTYIVREIPAFMELSEAEDFLKDIVNEVLEHQDFTNHKTVEKIIMKSCKSAVKGGDSLDNLEIDALMKDLRNCENPFSCPHGRPTFIRMTKYEIEKMFKRV